MDWMNKQTTLVTNHNYTTGAAHTLRDVMMSKFARNINEIVALRKLDRAAPDYKQKKKEIKTKLQCFSPSSAFVSRAKNNTIITSHTGLLQLDFDYEDIKDYDIEELKHAVFKLPFIAFCGLSCSGDGFYALAAIAKPEKLAQYAEHCFTILINEYGVKPDITKGKNLTDLRYVSYDSNMLLRTKPEQLLITNFIITKEASPALAKRTYSNTDGSTTQQQVERLINELSQNNIDITEGYNNWLSIGFAMASEFGKNGRGYFHDVSAVNSNYNKEESEAKYNSIIAKVNSKNSSKTVTIATFFHACKEAGLTLKTIQ